MVDFLALADGSTVVFEGERVATHHTHGTGCTLASAIAAGLAQGLVLADSVKAAREYVLRGILHSHPTGKGYGTLLHEPFKP